MLSLSLGWKEKKVNFMGEEITFSVKPFSTPAYLKMQSFIDDVDAFFKKRAEMRAEIELELDDERHRTGKAKFNKMVDDVLLEKLKNEDSSAKFFYEAQKLGAEVFPDHLKDGILHGIEVDGKPVDVEMLTTASVLSHLAFLVISEMVSASTIDQVALKNLP